MLWKKLHSEEAPNSSTQTIPIHYQSLYNIDNVQIVSNELNVRDTIRIGEKMANSFINSFPPGFHVKISSQVKTMGQLKRGKKVGDKIVFGLETLFIRLLMVVQKRQL